MTTVVDRDAISTRSVRDDPAVDADARHWALAADARDALRLRHAFRAYLEARGHPASDFHAAEVVYGELLANCVRHAPGPVRVEFRWADATLAVTDRSDRLRSWPFSPEDWAAETTHHGYALVSRLARRVHLARAPHGGTRASVVLPVLRREGPG
jgi:anti-sigma regulatory factor (Ser/Thr protein kinase)